MTLISETDQKALSDLVRDSETRTSAEIVCVIARSASDYRSVPLLWAALAAFAVPWPLINLLNLSAATVYRCQLGTFLILALVLSFAGWRFALVPRLMKRRRAAQAAREQFFAQGLYRTSDRTGILIYIAEAERYAEILVDDGVAARTDPAFWRVQVEGLTHALRQGAPIDGLSAVIRSCGDALAAAIPPRPAGRNELPDAIIVL